MSHDEAVQRAVERMCEHYDAMCPTLVRIQQLRDAGLPVPNDVLAEWDELYGHFKRAHEDWKRLASE